MAQAREQCDVRTICMHVYYGMCTENFQSSVQDLISTERNLWLMIALELIRRSTRSLSHSSVTELCVMLIGCMNVCMYVYRYSTHGYGYFMVVCSPYKGHASVLFYHYPQWVRVESV